MCPSATLASLYINILNSICAKCSAVEALKNTEALMSQVHLKIAEKMKGSVQVKKNIVVQKSESQ